MPSKVLLLNLGSQWSTQHVEQLVANAYGVLQEAAPAGLKCGLHAIPGSNQVREFGSYLYQQNLYGYLCKQLAADLAPGMT